MGLIYSTASSLLKQVVGGQGFTGSTTYLALSSTKPVQYPEEGLEKPYNITEPSEASYKRVALTYGNTSLYFTDPVEAIKDLETGNYTFKISNSREIHFPECTDVSGWNSGNAIGYFAIFASETGGIPLYVGALESEIYVINNTVPLVRVGNLSISVE